MYRGFNIRGINERIFKDHFESLKDEGRRLCKNYSTKVVNSLEKFLIDDKNVLDASAIQRCWFPTYKDQFDIFISHSHNDADCAYALAGWLKRVMNINCFVDGEVWGSADGLIKKIDMYFQNKKNLFDYKKRNLTTSQIHALLFDSIMQMEENCECLFFLNTPQSTQFDEVIKNRSLSPWLFLEIGISKMIKKERNYKRRQSFSRVVLEGTELSFLLDLSHLTDLNVRSISAWVTSFKDQEKAIIADNQKTGGGNRIYPLDVLYDLNPLPGTGIL